MNYKSKSTSIPKGRGAFALAIIYQLLLYKILLSAIIYKRAIEKNEKAYHLQHFYLFDGKSIHYFIFRHPWDFSW